MSSITLTSDEWQQIVEGANLLLFAQFRLNELAVHDCIRAPERCSPTEQSVLNDCWLDARRTLSESLMLIQRVIDEQPRESLNPAALEN